LAGQVGTDATGRAPESLVEQMQNAYQHVKSVLKEFDCTMDNVVEETWFVTDMHECMSQVEALFTARQMIYGKTPEVAQTVVQVVALVDPSFKIEIKCVAIAD
jgi:enamine deaminase RidA (YjgF/YER057c/UK114 family)